MSIVFVLFRYAAGFFMQKGIQAEEVSSKSL